VTSEQWISNFAGRIDIDSPSPDETNEILKLAGIAAHASERISAPLACWIAGRSGRSPEELCRIAQELG